MNRLEGHTWPGNARELENAIESALAFADERTLEEEDFPGLGFPAKLTRRDAGEISDLPLSLDAYERAALLRALEESGGDVAAAARLLGIGRSTLYRKLTKHELRR